MPMQRPKRGPHASRRVNQPPDTEERVGWKRYELRRMQELQEQHPNDISYRYAVERIQSELADLMRKLK